MWDIGQLLKALPGCIAALSCCSNLPWQVLVGNAAALRQPYPVSAEGASGASQGCAKGFHSFYGLAAQQAEQLQLCLCLPRQHSLGVPSGTYRPQCVPHMCNSPFEVPM